MSPYYGYSGETTLALTESAIGENDHSPKPVGTRPDLGLCCVDPKYAAMNLSPYLPGLAQILH